MKTLSIPFLAAILFSHQVFAMSMFEQEPEIDEAASTASADVMAAISEGDMRLLGLGMRVVSLPGVDNGLYDEVRKRCGVRLLHANDTLGNDDQRTDLGNLITYAERYNTIMLGHCMQ